MIFKVCCSKTLMNTSINPVLRVRGLCDHFDCSVQDCSKSIANALQGYFTVILETIRLP